MGAENTKTSDVAMHVLCVQGADGWVRVRGGNARYARYPCELRKNDKS